MEAVDMNYDLLNTDKVCHAAGITAIAANWCRSSELEIVGLLLVVD